MALLSANAGPGRAPAAPVASSWKTFRRATAALLVAAICAICAAPASANALKLGEEAPPLVLHTLDGRSIATRDLRGQVVVVTFWATWCSFCNEELPLLSAFAKRHAADGLQVLGFSLDDDVAKVKDVSSRLQFPVGLLGSPWAGGYGRIWRLPVTFVIDRSGRLAYNGWNDKQPVWTRERLESVVAPLLAQPNKEPPER
ncbi:MAG: TlpA disulfide reductase family protein [Betaproteobacteria bacterium]|nr:TlpA disulfide reductase family protein [Betaproteobacteria bacterium]